MFYILNREQWNGIDVSKALPNNLSVVFFTIRDVLKNRFYVNNVTHEMILNLNQMLAYRAKIQSY
jgi:hypothetical protein